MNTTKISAWQRFVSLLQLDKKDIRQIFYYAIFTGLVALSLPLGIQAIINLIQGAQVSTSWIVLVVLVTVGVGFQGALQLMQIRILENIQQKIFTRSSFEFAYRFPKIKSSELRDYYPPELANRFFDTLTVQKGLSKILIDFPTAFLQVIFGLLLLSFYHPFFIIYGILLLALVYTVFKFTAQKGLQTSLEESKNKYKIAHWLQEVARTIVSFKLSGRTQHALQKTDGLVYGYLGARESHFKILMLQFGQMIGFKILVTGGLLAIGGILVLNQEMNIGQFVAAEIVILLIISSVEKMILGLESFYDILTSLEKLGQVVDKELENQDGEKPFKADENFTVELDRISFKVPNGKQILDDISLTITPGCSILLNGSNGSGKTTLLRLIAGLIDPNQGAIYVNNSALASVNLNYYRSFIGQSLTEESPFEGTILENISFGDTSIPIEDVYWAIEKAGLQTFLKEQEKGLNTIIYPEGRQLPSIVHKPKLLILKNPLDQFDVEETSRIITFLTDPSNPWTLVVVSNHPKWKMRCNTMITLEGGKIIKEE